MLWFSKQTKLLGELFRGSSCKFPDTDNSRREHLSRIVFVGLPAMQTGVHAQENSEQFIPPKG